MLQPLHLALDWTPNINHIGFFVAQHHGWYADQGLAVTLSHPGTDDYATTPAKKVELGQADVALCPTESVISYRTKTSPFDLVAIAAVLQQDLSAIATWADAGIRSPCDLDGKVYSSYQARYEDGIVRELIRNDGGSGDLQITYPSKLGIWDTLLSGDADATWIFLNWEGVAARAAGQDLHCFALHEYGIPYSYSPVLAASATWLQDKEEACRAFLQATKQGFLACIQDPAAAIDVLRPHLPAHEQDFDLAAALALTVEHFGDQHTWGQLDPAKLDTFLRWIKEKGLETAHLLSADLFTDVCLPKENGM